jgi:pyruvate dehydrogenase E1 component alpha subunit
MTEQELIDFEKEIEEIYNTGVVRGPIHLRGGNEQQLIDIFKDVNPQDYVFSTWSNHLHALLKGIPRESVKARILEGESMAMNFPGHNFYTSAIVGGIAPIAVGVAHSLRETTQRVWCFLGDMAFRTGIAHESIMYAIGHDLPITFVVEDNNKSVGTPTDAAWGAIPTENMVNMYFSLIGKTHNKPMDNFDLIYYKYQLDYAHSGTGTWVDFKGF